MLKAPRIALSSLVSQPAWQVQVIINITSSPIITWSHPLSREHHVTSLTSSDDVAVGAGLPNL